MRRRLVTLFPVRYRGADRRIQIYKTAWIKNSHPYQEPVNSALPGLAFVVGSAFQGHPALEKYAALKQSQGYQTHWIKAGRSAEETRLALRHLLQSPEANLRYALIIGDQEDVSAPNAEWVTSVTDHYFSAIDRDPYLVDIGAPDIVVGRLAVNTPEELTAVIDKLIRYQTSKQDWKKQASFLATNDSTHWKEVEATHDKVIQRFMMPLNFTGNFPLSEIPGGGPPLCRLPRRPFLGRRTGP